MFGRRKNEEQREAAREVERSALFAELAKRPDTVCPFLGLAASRIEYHDGFTREHRCFAFGDPSELSSEQQERVCLQRGYGNCPRYLRGVLVIPTEELEALRRPLPALPPPPPPEPAAEASGGRRGILVAILAVLLVVGGGGGTFLLLNGNGTAVVPTPTPTASIQPSPTATDSVAPSATPSGPPPTATPDPTPVPEDVFSHYEVNVAPGDYVLYQVDPDTGARIRERGATFSANSQAPVERNEMPDGTPYWRTLVGEYANLSYIYPDSGPFRIRAVYTRPDGSRSSELLPESEL